MASLSLLSLPTWCKKLSLVVFLLVLLPATLTLLQLRHEMQRSQLCLVSGGGNGLYASSNGIDSYMQIPIQKRNQFWQSVVRVSTMLATPRSELLLHGTKMDLQNGGGEIRYLSGQWCLTSSNGNAIACSQTQQTTTRSFPPPSGKWKLIDAPRDSSTEFIEVSCPGSSPAASTFTASSWFSSFLPSSRSTLLVEGIRKNPNKTTSSLEFNRNLEWVLVHPATTILLFLNVMLAFLYWNYHIDPARVAKIYSKIVFQNELWRSFSGATAHFDALHIGFNMMSLYSLGTELESSFGCIPFLLYNVSLMPITTILMMGIVYLQIKISGDTNLEETSTVGYSGVLFAWMVVASLERPSTCPIPFMPETCFDTWQYQGFKLNASPLVQLVVAQFIMKRVSFVGHLAGIVAGFLLHWNLLPLELVQPNMLLPTILLCSYRHSHLIPINTASQLQDNNDETMVASFRQERNSANATSSRQSQRKREEERVYSVCVWLRNCMVAVLVVGILPFGVVTSMTWSYALVLALFWFVLQSFQLTISNDARTKTRETPRLATLLRGHVVMSIVLMVTDSLTLGGWIVSRVYFDGAPSMWLAFGVLISRLMLQLVALVVAVKMLSDANEIGQEGIFVNIFGRTILEPSKAIATAVSAALTKRRAAFEGRGVALGSGSTTATVDENSEGGQLSSHVL